LARFYFVFCDLHPEKIDGNQKPGAEPGLEGTIELNLANVLVEGFFYYIAVYVSHNLFLHLAAFKDQQGGNTTHAVTLGRCRTAVHVHLSDPYFALVCRSHFIHTGASILQGPHQAAQKSIMTGWSLLRTSWSKLPSVISRIPTLSMNCLP
jgi:hypothetical protein